jgi:hypothetical protein
MNRVSTDGLFVAFFFQIGINILSVGAARRRHRFAYQTELHLKIIFDF